ncbi:MAG: hypothetical protein A2268_03585 [Candidatus Raymondbacteria bacterium RifOxyA12_full_50_37]|nr:MAG: hypothetical protein A2268_03585 [Candidatus Raymondbacteria bacterium RifOxyA12_full_50_37]OGJ91876.1 MAG: hypothetical protein A2248_04655 [Candidatus Raymondbacteria bacterium RIFOXYA2_FULL_49_16]OGJ98086.1 MAG: hypothetical protein A2453_12360 [Candidatus Raymondbacteria bacterium RIFOXYC2_FULL_50_21]OGJ98097.1 MAG: hypothetical protein A2487_03915 [Candidatus Raymondbacteria bacterium RifOxyC12_full_50_8]OGK02327.1 MAG: hypothetical protein A2350_03070 [Candidatus Raymondbacteria b
MIGIVFFAQCAKQGTTGGASQGTAARTVLIAMGHTEYEDSMANHMRAVLEQRRIVVKVVSIDTVDMENPGVYDAIVMMHAIKENMMKPEVQNFLRNTPTGQKGPWPYVIISTVSGQDWISSDSQLDGVSAATRNMQVKNVATLILGRVDAILEGRFK